MLIHRRATRIGALIAALTLGATLAACGGNDNGGGGGGSNNANTGGGQQGQTSTQILNPSAKKGGTLQPLASSDCDYWDPQRWISRQLITYEPHPNPALTGDLAVSVPKSTDLKTWTYKLRSGIKFEDGTPITSKDIKYGIERVFAQDVINGGPTYPVDFLDDPANKYPGPYKDKDPNKLGLKSVETPDDSTIIFHLNKPFADWNYVMATPQSTPVPRAKDTGARYTFHPVASGPYKIESYTPNKQITLIRNPQWDPATDPNRKALPDKIVETMGLDLADIDNRIINNQADFFIDQTGVQVAAQAKILGDQTLRARTNDFVTGFLRYLTVFSKVKPFDNVHCRNAIAYVVNKVGQQTARGGPVGGGEVATTMITPPIKGYQKFDLFPTDGGRGDVTKAKAELAACGKPNGFSTKLTTRTNGRESRQAESLQADLKKIGINATIEKFDPSQYFAAQLGIPANVHAKGYGLGMAAWGPDWPSAWAFFSSIVDGRKILPQGNSNYAELNDPTVNKALDDGVQTDDPAVQAKAWNTADRAVVQSADYIPLLYDKALNVYSNRATNIYFTPGFLMSDFANIGVMK